MVIYRIAMLDRKPRYNTREISDGERTVAGLQRVEGKRLRAGIGERTKQVSFSEPGGHGVDGWRDHGSVGPTTGRPRVTTRPAAGCQRADGGLGSLGLAVPY